MRIWHKFTNYEFNSALTFTYFFLWPPATGKFCFYCHVKLLPNFELVWSITFTFTPCQLCNEHIALDIYFPFPILLLNPSIVLTYYCITPLRDTFAAREIPECHTLATHFYSVPCTYCWPNKYSIITNFSSSLNCPFWATSSDQCIFLCCHVTLWPNSLSCVPLQTHFHDVNHTVHQLTVFFIFSLSCRPTTWVCPSPIPHHLSMIRSVQILLCIFFKNTHTLRTNWPTAWQTTTSNLLTFIYSFFLHSTHTSFYFWPHTHSSFHSSDSTTFTPHRARSQLSAYATRSKPPTLCTFCICSSSCCSHPTKLSCAHISSHVSPTATPDTCILTHGDHTRARATNAAPLAPLWSFYLLYIYIWLSHNILSLHTGSTEYANSLPTALWPYAPSQHW